MLKTYEKIIMWMKTEELGTKKHALDNKISKEYKVSIKANGASHELVPQGDFRYNIPKKSIQTFKKYFEGLLACLHKCF